MAKSPDAFRTISEVADWLGIQAHVLRFWESKFSQVKPIKRAGGRRYYRPGDMLLLGGIKKLLHDDGLTIKGVQKILREEGMSHVAALSEPLDELTQSELEREAFEPVQSAPEPAPAAPAEPEKGVVLEFAAPEEPPETEVNDAAQAVEEEQEDLMGEAEDDAEATADVAEPTSQPAPASTAPEVMEPAAPEAVPEEQPAPAEAAAEPDTPADPATAPVPLPAFLRRPLAEVNDPAPEPESAPEPEPEPEPEQTAPTPEPPATPKPKPRIVDVPPPPSESDIPAVPAALNAAFRARRLSPDQADRVRPLLQQLTALRDSMAARRHAPAARQSKD